LAKQEIRNVEKHGFIYVYLKEALAGKRASKRREMHEPIEDARAFIWRAQRARSN